MDSILGLLISLKIRAQLTYGRMGRECSEGIQGGSVDVEGELLSTLYTTQSNNVSYIRTVNLPPPKMKSTIKSVSNNKWLLNTLYYTVTQNVV